MHRPTAVAARGALCAALCAASPLPAAAQQPGLQADAPAVLALERRRYSCVDPADVLARRTAQDAPCTLPMYHLPAPEGPGSADAGRRSLSLPRQGERGPGHAMFWRFPVQPRGPYEAPRHTWR